MTLEPPKQSPKQSPGVEQDNQPEGQSAILNLYAAFLASLVLGVIPYATAALFSLIFLFGVLVGAYVVQGDAPKDSLKENHATYIIKTFWISSLFLLITFIFGAIYIYSGLDTSALDPCLEKIYEQGPTWVQNATHADIYALVQPCVPGYLEANKMRIITGLAISVAPVLPYVLYRLIRGLSRAAKGYRLAKPRSWF